MRIMHSFNTANASRQLGIVTMDTGKMAEKLSSGYRINRSADDAAGLKISEKMRWQIRGLNRASDNAQEGISLLNVADGAMGETEDIVQRIRELAVQGANDTNTEQDRQALQKEIDSLRAEIDRIAESTEFNTIKLLDGSKETYAYFADGQFHLGQYRMQGTSQIQPTSGVVVSHPVNDPSAVAALSGPQLNQLNTTLADSIVPQAVNSLLNAFPVLSRAAGNNQVSEKIGLKIYNNPSTSVLASVSIGFGTINNRIADNSIKLNLSVNTSTLAFQSDGSLTSGSRTALETTIVHEMMHAFMDDVLPNGMIGADQGMRDQSNAFPLWFIEGSAQAAAGGCSNDNDWVNGGMGLNENSSAGQISAAVRGDALGSNSGTSNYGTGYLAVMYLGYLAAGKPSAVSGTNLAAGVNKVLKHLYDGASLDAVVKSVSGGAYANVADFQTKFGDADSAAFIHKLLVAAGTGGNGGLAGRDLTRRDLLSDGNTTSSVYRVESSSEFVVSSVGASRNWASGGLGRGTAGISEANGLFLQVGALSGQAIAISLGDMHSDVLGIAGLTVSDYEQAGQLIHACDDALANISYNRSQVGAYTNRLEFTIQNLDNTSENTQSAESRIRDTDMAQTMVMYSRDKILAQAGQAVLAQAARSNESVLRILNA